MPIRFNSNISFECSGKVHQLLSRHDIAWGESNAWMINENWKDYAWHIFDCR